MEEIRISGPNGEIYGVLQTPETERAAMPLIILSHGIRIPLFRCATPNARYKCIGTLN